MGISNPFYKDPLLNEMHRSVIDVIHRSSFSFALPTLDADAWKIICTDPRARERLEFLGDSLIGTQVSEGLIQHWPSETPGFYTKCRTILVANSTFAYLMWKAGICKLAKNVKPAGDAFEAILALYHDTHGLENFKRYIHESFRPLFKAVGQSYHDNVDKLRKRKHEAQLQDRRLSEAAKSARELASSVYRRHDTPRSIKSTLVNKKQRIYENQSPRKTPRKPSSSRADPSNQTRPRPEIRHRDVVDLTQGPYDDHGSDKRPVEGPDYRSNNDAPARRTTPTGPSSFRIKPEPFEPTVNNLKVPIPPPQPEELTRAPVELLSPFQYPVFPSIHAMDIQTQDILLSASESQKELHPPPLPPPVASQALPPLPATNPNRNDTGPSTHPPTMTTTKHRRVASGTADDLADMFASRATLALPVVPVKDPAPAPGHGTKEDPITILDDDDD